MSFVKNENTILSRLPATRYQGSKRRVAHWIFDVLKEKKFESILDGFGGSASISYLFKLMGKQVVYNDYLLSNYQVGLALIENDKIVLNDDDLKFLTGDNGYPYPTFIQETFEDIYYLDEENRWLDMVVSNIGQLSGFYRGRTLKMKRALAFYILFQCCLIKRPFNLFHRKNLYLRTAEVERTFGNKIGWDADFQKLFVRISKLTDEKIFSNGHSNKCLRKDIFSIKENHVDLVYLDPPYIRKGDSRPNDYRSLYHFLEGLVDYENWPKYINWNTKNRGMLSKTNTWDSISIEEKFDQLFSKFQKSIIVLSYGSPGMPDISELRKIMHRYKTKVTVHKRPYNYKLNKSNGQRLFEVLMIGE